MNDPNKNKPPGIRPGQKTPFRKATDEEKSERVEWLANQFAGNPLLTNGAAKKLMATRYRLKHRQIAEYIARARNCLDVRANMSKSAAKEIGVNALLNILAKEKGSVVVQAERRLSEIFGYNAPAIVQNRLADAQGKPFSPTAIAPIVRFIIPHNNRGPLPEK